jgi:hypothetical protein
MNGAVPFQGVVGYKGTVYLVTPCPSVCGSSNFLEPRGFLPTGGPI